MLLRTSRNTVGCSLSRNTERACQLCRELSRLLLTSRAPFKALITTRSGQRSQTETTFEQGLSSRGHLSTRPHQEKNIHPSRTIPTVTKLLGTFPLQRHLAMRNSPHCL